MVFDPMMLFLPMFASLIAHMASSLKNAVTGKEVRRAGQEGGFLPLFALPGRKCMDHMDGSYGWIVWIMWIDLMSQGLIVSFKKIKDENGTYVINLYKQNEGAHGDSLLVDRNTAVYFDCFGIEYIPQEIFIKINDTSIIHNRFRIQDDDSVMCMCRFYLIAFKKYMFAGKTLIGYTIFFLLTTIKIMTI